MINGDMSFTFHISHPNNEDVEPVIYKNWLAVADGMGGSGCMRHTVDKKFHKNLAEVLRHALPEYTERDRDRFSEFNVFNIDNFAANIPSYLSRIFSACINEDVNTSARWASRIVMTRFLYYITEVAKGDSINLDDKAQLYKIAQFITDGLVKVRDDFSLTLSNSSMAMLPTTFAALHHTDTDDGECIVHAVWAGDSRCYVLDGNGLRQISADDEDNDKLLTNHFCADYTAQLNCRCYKFKKPFILICASDGFFDAYDKTGLTVEAKLLRDIYESESAVEFYEKLVMRYDGYPGDDTSVAFVPVGFENFGQIKQTLSGRFEYVSGLFKKHAEYSSMVNLLSRPEHHVTASVFERIEFKFGEIIASITDAYYAGEQDIMLTQEWREIIGVADADCTNKLNERVELLKRQLGKTVIESIRAKGYNACFRSDVKGNDYIANRIFELRDLSKVIQGLNNEIASLDNRVREQKTEKAKLHGEILDRQRGLLTEIGDLIGKMENSCENDFACIEEMNKIQNKLDRIDIQFKLFRKLHGKDFGISKELKRDYRIGKDFSRIEAVKNSNAATQAEIKKRDCEKAKKKYDSCLNGLANCINQIISDRTRFFTDEFISELNMNSVMEGRVKREEVIKAVKESLTDRYKSDGAMIAAVQHILKDNPAYTSCIDGSLTAGKLAEFRKYYLYRDSLNSEVYSNYRNELAAYEKALEQLLCDDALYVQDGREEVLPAEKCAAVAENNPAETYAEASDGKPAEEYTVITEDKPAATSEVVRNIVGELSAETSDGKPAANLTEAVDGNKIPEDEQECVFYSDDDFYGKNREDK